MTNSIVTLSELAAVPPPQKTDTYIPVPHVELINLIREEADKVGLRPIGNRNEFKAARYGNLVSGKLIFVGDEDGVDMQVGFANSYDKTRSVMIGVGAEVFICLNGAMSAEYEMRRKHTTNIWSDLKPLITESMNSLYSEYRMIIRAKERLNGVELSKRKQAELLGRLFVEENLVTPVMANIVRKEIQESTTHPDDTAWSFYNHVTYALKRSHPIEYIDNHIRFHEFMTHQFN